MVLACLCGSDLWFYRGISELPHGTVGHEFIGVVDQIGSDVADLQTGDFVISPFAFCDGTCPHCRAGFHTACIHGRFFGQGGTDDGGQAEYLRVPKPTARWFPYPERTSPTTSSHHCSPAPM